MIEAVGGTHEVIEMPGALEIPTAIRIAHRQSNFDGFVALGCVIRGETTHYETVCNDSSSRALTLLGLEGACIGNGILTVENHCAGRGSGRCSGSEQGWRARLRRCLHLIALTRRFWQCPKGAIWGSSPVAGVIEVAQRRRHRMSKPSREEVPKRMRSAARLYATQALYQMEAIGRRRFDKVRRRV